MQFFQGVIDVTDAILDTNCLGYLEIIANYLDSKEINISYSIFKGSSSYDDEEMWQIPKEFVCLYNIPNLTICSQGKCLNIGSVYFGVYNNKKVVIEQNASPIQVYWSN
jgi:hypothetical protein